MVLYGHLEGTRGYPSGALANMEHWAGDLAHLGVLVFFVISGFLITTLLMGEYEQTGTISLRTFYFRRALRIFPAFYAFLIILFVASLLGAVHLEARDFAFAATYMVNYYPHHPWQIGHLWSLSIEEQFYFVWPLLLLILRERRALILAVSAIIVAPVLRALLRIYVGHVAPHSVLGDMSIFPAMFDYIATGCALALMRPWLLQRPWYRRLTASRWLVLAVPLILVVNRFDGYTLVMLLGSPLLNVCIALLIEASTRHTGSWVGRALNWKPVAALGVLSYSLYLWQQLFIDRYSSAWMNAFPQNVLLSGAVALLSYFLVEGLFMGLRNRLRYARQAS